MKKAVSLRWVTPITHSSNPYIFIVPFFQTEYPTFYVINSYVPNSGSRLERLDYRMEWDNDFFEYMRKLDKVKPIIWCGDLNVAHAEIDLANPKQNVCHSIFHLIEILIY